MASLPTMRTQSRSAVKLYGRAMAGMNSMYQRIFDCDYTTRSLLPLPTLERCQEDITQKIADPEFQLTKVTLKNTLEDYLSIVQGDATLQELILYEDIVKDALEWIKSEDPNDFGRRLREYMHAFQLNGYHVL